MILLSHLATLIFVVTLGKQFVDRKCQENYTKGVIDSTKKYKIQMEESIKEAYRTGIEQGEKKYLQEYKFECKEGLREYWDFNEIAIQNAINKYEEG